MKMSTMKSVGYLSTERAGSHFLTFEYPEFDDIQEAAEALEAEETEGNI
ncbi:hypothetical protein [Rossellomorea marisflavi]